MCEKCVELEAKIAHYRQLAGSVADRRALDGIDALIASLQAKITDLHPKAHDPERDCKSSA